MKFNLTIITFLFTIFIFSQSKLDYQVHDFYNGSSYEPTFKTLYQYNIENQLTRLEHLSWDNQDEIYTNEAKNLYSYDTNGNKIESILYYWNGQEYLLEEKNSYTYDATNKLIQTDIFFWNGVNYEPDSQTIYTYNQNNKLTEYNSYSWNGSEWIIEDRSVATFNSNGNISYIIEEVGSEVSSLTIYSKEEFIYNTNDKIIERIFYFWDEEEEEFIPNNKKTYNLDTNNNLISSIEYDYDDEYIPVYKFEYTFDFTQLQSSYIHPFNIQNIETSYLSDILEFNFLQDFPYHNKILEKTISEYDEFDETYDIESRFVFHYSESTANTVNFIQNTINISPNPAKDKLYIKTKKNIKIRSYKLYDNTGNLVTSTTLSIVDIHSLSSGVYILKVIDTNGNSYQKKVIKK